ncbi:MULTISPECIES: hypothetical protein [unclassified Rathayibacter]|uniref:hypothetical protein n=1 Tax=unclassified Rathayibacter TaxID=2609250 RepID=UPI001FB2FC4E|nr:MULTISPECIES: hypothetical protein [unclassified Rathayibacter]MCJ1685140.1 hypothetical protein [Rathayibacter sp. VKM Ac-2928]MCJ1688945.1 hypothetical protein [Rathayibacter sp. VKM Ac-2927]
MDQFWQAWWPRIETLNIAGALLWAMWLLVVMPALDTGRAPDTVMPSERHWLRILGRIRIISGPGIPEASGGGPAWRRFQALHETDARSAQGANCARLAVPSLLAYVALAAGLLQLGLTLVCLLPHDLSSILISLALVPLGFAQVLVTMTLRDRHWRNRQVFEWQFFERMVHVRKALDSGRFDDSDRRDTLLDPIETCLVERFSRTPTALPSQRTRAQRWTRAVLRVCAGRPRLDTADSVLPEAEPWLERCTELALSRSQSRISLLGCRSAGAALPPHVPPKREAGLRTAWATIVFYTYAFFVLSLEIGDQLAPAVGKIGEFVGSPVAGGAAAIAAALPPIATLIARVIKR